MIELKNISFGYGTRDVIKDVSLDIKLGDFITIIGPNGSGKSTLVKLINNIYSPDKGQVLYAGKNIKDYSPKELARNIGMVSQETNIEYEFTVEEIVLMGRYPYKSRFEGLNEKDIKIAYDAMKSTNTFDLKDRLVTNLSGGEKQRVLIARAISQTPEVIILDEPTSSLDLNHQIEILELLKKLNREKSITIILVIHDINLASRYSENIVILNKGEIIEKGSPEQVISKNNMKEVYNMDIGIETNQFTKKLSITPIQVVDRVK